MNQFCEDKDVVIDDVTCKETSEFVCTKEQPTEEYGPKVTVCRPVPKKNCYKTPRTVSVMKMLNMISICVLPRSGRSTASPPPNASARSSPTPSYSQWRSRTATLSQES